MTQMTLAEHDHMIQALASNRTDHSFGIAVLPWRSSRFRSVAKAHLADQLPNFERHLRPANSSSRLPAPEQAETSAMPAQNGVGLDDREGIQNTRRHPIQADENQAIEVAEDRPLRRASVQHVQLM